MSAARKNKEVKMSNFRTNTVLTLGSLQVYTLEVMVSGHMQLDNPQNGFYWVDAGSPQGYGPFKSVGDTMEHYAALMRISKGVVVHTTKGPELRGKVIRVDFRLKTVVRSEITE